MIADINNGDDCKKKNLIRHFPRNTKGNLSCQ